VSAIRGTDNSRANPQLREEVRGQNGYESKGVEKRLEVKRGFNAVKKKSKERRKK
jgi:hypothetical protein